MDLSRVAATLDELGAVLRADGADLVLVAADPATDRVEVRLELGEAACLDCIMPPQHLREVIEASLRRQVPLEFELVVHDPRAKESPI